MGTQMKRLDEISSGNFVLNVNRVSQNRTFLLKIIKKLSKGHFSQISISYMNFSAYFTLLIENAFC